MRVVWVGCDQVIICQLHEVVACLFNIFSVIFEELMYFQNHTKKPYLSGPKVGHCHSRGKGLEAQLNTCKLPCWTCGIPACCTCASESISPNEPNPIHPCTHMPPMFMHTRHMCVCPHPCSLAQMSCHQALMEF